MPASKGREKRDLSVFDPVPGCADLCQAIGVAKGESTEGRVGGSEWDGSAEGPAAPGREMETVVLLCLLAAVWTSWFWSFLVLWALAESVAILRRWEGMIRGA